MENYDQSSTPPSDHMAPVSGNYFDVPVISWNELMDTYWISKQMCVEYVNSMSRTRTCTDGGKNSTFQEKFVSSEALKAESQEWKMYHLEYAIPEVIKVTVQGRVYPDVGGGGTSNEEVKKQKMEALKKIIDDAVKSHINTIVLLPTNEVDTRVDIEPDNNADPTSGKAQLQLMKKTIGEATLEKVNEIVLAISGQAAFSLMAYASINSSLTSEPNSPTLIAVVGTNTIAFIASLGSLSFREKMPRAASFLAKVGGIAVAASVVGALAMYLPVNIQWASSLAFALPALAILYA